MASEIVTTERKTIAQELAEMPADFEPELVTDPLEVKFIQAWRAADDEGKRYLDKTLRLAVAGLLPPAETVKGMTESERRAFIDAIALEAGRS